MTIIRQGLDNAALKALFSSSQGGLYKDMQKRGMKVESAAKKNLSGDGGDHPKRVDTGRLRSSIMTVMVTVDGLPAAEVGTNVEYSLAVHDGTGIFGPHGEPIRPTSAKALKWKSKTYGAKKGKYKGYAFATSVKGMPPNPFLRDALPAAKT